MYILHIYIYIHIYILYIYEPFKLELFFCLSPRRAPSGCSAPSRRRPLCSRTGSGFTTTARCAMRTTRTSEQHKRALPRGACSRVRMHSALLVYCGALAWCRGAGPAYLRARAGGCRRLFTYARTHSFSNRSVKSLFTQAHIYIGIWHCPCFRLLYLELRTASALRPC